MGLSASYDAVLLDLDGTLVRSEQVHRRAWRGFFAHWDVEVDDAEYARTFMGRRARDVLEQVRGPWTGSDLDVSVGLLREHSRHAAGAVEAVPGAPELLRALTGTGTPVAVVTSAGRAWADTVLRDVLDVRVPTLVTAERVREGKPSPEGYLLACTELAVAPGRCAGLEDSPSGIAALVAAGVGTVVGITTTSPADVLRAAGAHETAPDLTSQRP